MFFISSLPKFENHWSNHPYYRDSTGVSSVPPNNGGATGGAPNAGARTQSSLIPKTLLLDWNAMPVELEGTYYIGPVFITI